MITIGSATQHRSNQSMMLYLLSTIDFSKTWEEIEYGLGYDLGDYSFDDRQWYSKTVEIAKAMWTQLHGFVDENGNAKKK